MVLRQSAERRFKIGLYVERVDLKMHSIHNVKFNYFVSYFGGTYKTYSLIKISKIKNPYSFSSNA
jgi:hypothetical protein